MLAEPIFNCMPFQQNSVAEEVNDNNDLTITTLKKNRPKLVRSLLHGRQEFIIRQNFQLQI